MPCGESWLDHGRHSAERIRQKYVVASGKAADCEFERDAARRDGRDREADLWCRRAEHHRGWATRFRNELRRRGVDPDLSFFQTLEDVT